MTATVPGERRAAAVAAAVTALTAVVTMVSALAAWDSGEETAVVALVVSTSGLVVACGALAGYTLWLRQAVSRRMTGLLGPYLVVVPAGPVRVSGELSLVGVTG